MQKHVNLVDLAKSFPTNIFLQNLASIQKRTSPVKFAHMAEKSEKGSIPNLSTKHPAPVTWWFRRVEPHPHADLPGLQRRQPEERELAVEDGAVGTLVERFDIEPYSDFLSK